MSSSLKKNNKKSSKKNQNEKNSMSKWILLGIAAAAALIGIIAVIVSSVQEMKVDLTESAVEYTEETVTEDETTAENLLVSADDLQITHYADIEIADYGTVTVALDRNIAPITVDNFVSLAESGFYDGLTFHRIIDGFMIQGGDPDGDGTGGSDETIKGEFSENGVENAISHVRGAISMARSTDADSASSQFFIVQSDSTYLDGQYAGFGFVTEGMEIVDQICSDAEPTDSNGTIEADAQPVITSVTIREVTVNSASETAESVAWAVESAAEDVE